MNKYILFLDESKINSVQTQFCLGRCIIEKQIYKTKIIPYIESLKLDVFNNIEVNLHETDIRNAKNEYKVMSNSTIRKLFWDKM